MHTFVCLLFHCVVSMQPLAIIEKLKGSGAKGLESIFRRLQRQARPRVNSSGAHIIWRDLQEQSFHVVHLQHCKGWYCSYGTYVCLLYAV